MFNPFEAPSHIRKLKPSKNLSFDEAFLDVQMEDASILEDEREQVNYRFLYALVFLGLLSLSSRIFFLQGIKGQEYQALSEGNKLRTQYVVAPRGAIVDRFGTVIAANVPSFQLVVVPSDLSKDEQVFNSNLNLISQTVGKSVDELLEFLKILDAKATYPFLMVENLPKEQALILLSKQDKLVGFAVQNNPIRDYRNGESFAHLVGFTGKINDEELKKYGDSNYFLNDYVGKTELELQYEQYLHGTPGFRQVEVDAQGKVRKGLAEIPGKAGNNVRLNIDFELQNKIYESLNKVMAPKKLSRAVGIATNPKTGEVLGLVSLPSFNNNLFAKGISREDYAKLINDKNLPLINRAVSGTYHPGSTVKPMLAIAALSEGIVTPETKILDDGVIRVGSFTFYGYRRIGLGLMDVYSAIARSSDIYFYTVGGGRAGSSIPTGLGVERLAFWYRKFNLGKILGIDLPNEKTGLVPDTAWKKEFKNEPWYLGDTYHYSIGQGDLTVTPLQVNSWTATIANGGKIMQPFVVSKVETEDGNVVLQNTPKVLAENFLDPNWVKVVQDGMRQAITAGSAQSLNSLPVAISGKTGTAQFDAKDLARTHAWFTSFAPSDDPQIALTILIEDGGEGSSVAAPVAKDVYTWWAANRLSR